MKDKINKKIYSSYTRGTSDNIIRTISRLCEMKAKETSMASHVKYYYKLDYRYTIMTPCKHCNKHINPNSQAQHYKTKKCILKQLSN